MTTIKIITSMLLISLLCSACVGSKAVTHDAINNPQDGRNPAETSGDAYENFMQHTFTHIGEDMDPDISIDGSQLLYASTNHSKSPDIFVKNINGKSYTQLTYDPASDRFPRFSPDGKTIVFASNRAGNWDLYRTSSSPSTEKPLRLTRRKGDELHPSWSPDGKKLVYNYYNSRKKDWEVWIMDMTTFKSRYICDGIMPEWNPQPKNPTIVFQRYRRRNLPWFGIWTVSAVEGQENMQTAVVTESKWAAINPAWSPDGKRIVFATVYKGREAKALGSLFFADDIWVVDADGENQQQLTNDAYPEWNPLWTKDGRIHFNRHIKNQKNIWSMMPILLDFSDEFTKNSPAPKSLPNETDNKKKPKEKNKSKTADDYVV